MSKPKMQKTSETGIYKRIGNQGTRYYVVVDVGVKASGKRDQRWHSGYRTLRDAKKARAEIIGRLERGTYIAPSRITFREFIEKEWLPAVKGQLRPSTFESYAANLRNHVLPQLGSHRLQHVSPAMLNKLYGDLTERLSVATVRYVHAITRHALADAVRWDRLARNPAERAMRPRPSAAKPAMHTWSADELRRFLHHVRGDRLYAAWRLLATTGMRRGELLGLHWRNLHLDGARAQIAETLIGSRRASTPKTDKGRRSVALDPETIAALRAHRKAQAAEKLALGPAYEDHALVFCREDGTPAWPQSFSRTFLRHARAAGLPRIPLKNLRHTHATLALQAGVHPKVVQERLGHANIGITLDVYSQAIPAMQEDAAATVAALIADNAGRV